VRHAVWAGDGCSGIAGGGNAPCSCARRHGLSMVPVASPPCHQNLPRTSTQVGGMQEQAVRRAQAGTWLSAAHGASCAAARRARALRLFPKVG
jgi:hypothetical protein